jgi:hypothetical protein
MFHVEHLDKIRSDSDIREERRRKCSTWNIPKSLVLFGFCAFFLGRYHNSVIFEAGIRTWTRGGVGRKGIADPSLREDDILDGGLDCKAFFHVRA